MNIVEMVPDREQLLMPSNKEPYIGFQFAYLHVTLPIV